MPKPGTNFTLLIARDGVELGRLSESEVYELLTAGFLRLTDRYQCEGSEEWKPLAELRLTMEPRGEKRPLLQQTAQSISAAPGALMGKGRVLTGKVAAFVSVKKTAVTEGTHRVLEDYLPEIRKLVAKQLIAKPAWVMGSAMRNDELMKNVFGAAHDCLPKPIRRFVPESVFIEFCLQNRKKLLHSTASEEQQPECTPHITEPDKPND